MKRVFDEAARAALYEIIALRRDIREFVPGPIDPAALDRILWAAQQAPSVGFSQPWAFVLVEDRATRAAIRESFLRCRDAEAARFPPAQREKYLSYKLEGIEDSALNVCVVADLRAREGVVLGTTAQPEAVRASVCCAVQNLWLAARAEGIGVGWVSIVEPSVLRRVLALPAGVEPVAYLCLGHPREFRARPLLEETGWKARRAPTEILHRERWREVEPSPPPPSAPSSPEPAPATIPPFDERAREASYAHQRTLTKPEGSLGRLEELAAWYAGAHGRFPPPPPDRVALTVFAADHGVTVEGVSAYGSQLTAAMVANVMAGGAAINALARRLRIDLALVDVGVTGDLSSVPTSPVVPLERARVRNGTSNLRREMAMGREDAERAMKVGGAAAARSIEAGAQLLAAGELGIGNTTSAAALVCAMTGARPDEVVGHGTGIDEAMRRRKVTVVEDALALHRPDPADPLGVLAAVGGLELAALAGFYLEAARRSVPVVVDGFLGMAAALVARAFDANVVDRLLASHMSAERGAKVAAEALGLRPLLDLGMRLGEGTGAALAADLVRTAVETQRTMATFATAGIVGRRPPW